MLYGQCHSDSPGMTGIGLLRWQRLANNLETIPQSWRHPPGNCFRIVSAIVQKQQHPVRAVCLAIEGTQRHPDPLGFIFGGDDDNGLRHLMRCKSDPIHGSAASSCFLPERYFIGNWLDAPQIQTSIAEVLWPCVDNKAMLILLTVTSLPASRRQAAGPRAV